MLRKSDARHVILLLAFVLAGCRQVEPAPTPTAIPTPIVPEKPTYVVERGPIVNELEFLGRIAPVVEQDLFFRMGGYVRAVLVQRDESVTTDQVLAELDVEDLEKQLAQAQVSLELGQAQLEEAERVNADQLAEARINLEKAQLRLAKLRAQNPALSVTVAAVRLEQAVARVKQAQAGYDRRAALPGAEASAAALQLEQATQDHQIASAQYDIASQEQTGYSYDVQLLEKDVELAGIALQRLEENENLLLTKDVETKRLTVERLKAQVEAAQIRSPIDGKVMSVSLYAGRSVEAFKPVIIVADATEVEVRADLVSNKMKDMAEGMKCVVRLSNSPGEEWAGEIRRLPYPYGSGGRSGAIDQEDTSTRISLDVEMANVEPGDLAKVVVVLERREDVLYLPPTAIRTFEGREFVVVRDGDAQRRVDVKLGLESEDRVEILEGLEEGDVVVGL